MIFDFSKLDLKDRPQLILKTLSDRTLQTLGYAMNVGLSLKYNEVSELTFDLPKAVDGKKTPHYDDVVGWNIIELHNLGRFILMDPQKSNTGIKEIKSCTAYSLEYEWIFKKIALKEDVYNFWNPVAPETTILGIIMDLVPSWTLGYVSPSLIGAYRSYDKSTNNLYDFVKSTVQKSVGCVFEFDSLTRTVYVRDVSSKAEVSPIFLSTQNLIKKMEIKEESQNILTCLDINGAEGVNIMGVNPTGLNALYNLDYFMTEANFDEAIRIKWNAWKRACEDYRQYYFDTGMERELQNSRYVTEKMRLDDLKIALNQLEKEQSGIIQAEDSSIKDDELEKVKIEIDKKTNEITAQEAVLKTVQDDIAAITARLQEINEELSFKNRFDANELLVLNRYFKEDSIQETTFVSPVTKSYNTADEAGDVKNSTFKIAPASGMTLDTPGVEVTKILQTYFPGKALYSIKGGVLTAAVKVPNENGELVSVELNSNINRGSFEKRESGEFVFSAYLGSGQYGDRKFASGCISMTGSCSSLSDNTVPDKDTPNSYATGTMMEFAVTSGYLYFTENLTEYQQRAVEWDLLDWGEDTARKLAFPSYSFSVDSSNFTALDDFRAFKEALTLGKKCYLKIDDDKILTPFVIGIDVSFSDISKMSIKFSDKFNSSDGVFQLKDLLQDAVSMGKTVDYSKYTYSSFIESGAATRVDDFMNNALDVAKNNVLSATGQAISWNENGMRFRKWNADHTGYEPEQIWAINNELVFSDDSFNSVKTAIGKIKIGDSSMYGISAEALFGDILAGKNLTIESQVKDGKGNSVFKVDGSGAQLHNATFDIFSGSNNHITLNPDIGFAMGTYPVFKFDADLQKTIIDTENAKVFFDIKDGKAVFKGKVEADSGSFNGSVTATDFYFKNGDSVKTLLGGSNGLTQIPNDAVNFYALNILNKQTKEPTFQIDTNGNVTLSGTINWDKTNSDPEIAGASEIAKQIADGTYSGGSFINGRQIFSPEIYTNILTIDNFNTAIEKRCGFDLRRGETSIFHVLYDAGEAISNINIGTDMYSQIMFKGNFLFTGGFATEPGTSFRFGGPISVGSQAPIDFSSAPSMKFPSSCDIDCHKISCGTGGISLTNVGNSKNFGITTTLERIFKRLKGLDGKSDSIFDYV